MLDLEAAANIGEALGVIAILLTLLFGIRQMREINRNRKYEIAQTIAASLENPLVQRGFSVYSNQMHKDSTIEELAALSREEKDAINAVAILMSNHAIMTYYRHLSFEIVSAFYKGYLPLISPGLRRTMQLIEDMYVHVDRIQITSETGFGMFHWVVWLLDRMEENPIGRVKPHVVHRNWKP